MYIQLYAIPGQIFLGMFSQFIYEYGVLYYLCTIVIIASLYACMYASSNQLFPQCISMIIPFQIGLTILNFDMVSVGIIPYLILTDLINSDIIKRLPKKPIPPPRRSFNPQIDNHHSIHIQNVIKQNAQSLKKYEYFHICCITLCYIAIPKYNYTPQLLNTAFLQYYFKSEYNTTMFKTVISMIKFILCSLTLDVRAILTVAILPNFINEQKIYSYCFLAEQFLINYLDYEYGVYHNLIIFLSFYIFDSQNKNTKQLTLLYIPLLNFLNILIIKQKAYKDQHKNTVYAFETQTEIYIYTYIVISLVYLGLLIIEQEKQVLYLRYILVIVGLFITEKWYYKLLLMIFLIDIEMNFNIKVYIQAFAGKQIFDLLISYSPLISHQLFQYKYDLNNFNLLACILSMATLIITQHIHQQNLIFSRLLQIYLLSLPIWPVLFYYDRSSDNLIVVLINIIQILLQFQKQE